jgi:hypothetical protein
MKRVTRPPCASTGAASFLRALSKTSDHILGVHVLGNGGRAGDIHEQQRDQLALLGWFCYGTYTKFLAKQV